MIFELLGKRTKIGHLIWILQGGPLLVINEVITPIKWPYKWITGVITLLIGVVTLLITGSGAHLVVKQKKTITNEIESRKQYSELQSRKLRF